MKTNRRPLGADFTAAGLAKTAGHADCNTEANGLPPRPELSFDGCGINGPDAYRTRIATFTDKRGTDAMKYGPLFAAAPAMLEALKQLRTACQQSRKYIVISEDDGFAAYNDTAEALNVADAALALAEKGEA